MSADGSLFSGPTGQRSPVRRWRHHDEGPKGRNPQARVPGEARGHRASSQAVVDERAGSGREERPSWSAARLVANMVTGVTEGYTRQLEINGVGYRAEIVDNKVNLWSSVASGGLYYRLASRPRLRKLRAQ